MAIAFIFETDRLDQTDYDDLMSAMDLGDLDARYPDGLLAHLSGATPDAGWRVIDVWESEDSANAFYGSERFAPVRAGATDGAITSTPWPLHRIEVRQLFRELV